MAIRLERMANGVFFVRLVAGAWESSAARRRGSGDAAYAADRRIGADLRRCLQQETMNEIAYIGFGYFDIYVILYKKTCHFDRSKT
jgi:hypothetical protein